MALSIGLFTYSTKRRRTVAAPAIARARRFSWLNTAARHVELYERLLEKRRPSRTPTFRPQAQVVH